MKDPYQDKKSISSKFRIKRARYVFSIIDYLLEHNHHCHILDIGGTENYWLLFDEELEKRRKNLTIYLTNLDKIQVKEKSIFKSQVWDATTPPRFSRKFDLVHSNSVIEHVGGWQQMKRLAQNVERLSKNYFIQTPSFWFPVEPHFRSLFFHWLPEQMRYKKILKRNYGFHKKAANISEAMETVQSAQLLDFSQIQALFPGSVIYREQFLFFPKSYMSIRVGDRKTTRNLLG